MTNFLREPRVHLIAATQFFEENIPEELRVQWGPGSRSDGEALVEFAGRLCYMSQHNPANKTTPEYVSNILKQAHGSVLEHASYSYLLEGMSRSCSHELVRHRAGWAYSQLSQRYVDESDTDYVIPPAILGTDLEENWCKDRELQDTVQYIELSNLLYERYADIEDKTLRRKTAREAARSVLPNATETKIVATANVRAWRSTLELRCGLGAEREIRRLFLILLKDLKKRAPSFFADFVVISEKGQEWAEPVHHKV